MKTAWEVHPCGCGRAFVSAEARDAHACPLNAPPPPSGPPMLAPSPLWSAGGQHAPHPRAPFAIGDTLDFGGVLDDTMRCVALTHGFAIFYSEPLGEPTFAVFDSYYGLPVEDDHAAALLDDAIFLDPPRRAWCWESLEKRAEIGTKAHIMDAVRQLIADGSVARSVREGTAWYSFVGPASTSDRDAFGLEMSDREAFWMEIEQARRRGLTWSRIHDTVPGAKHWQTPQSLCTTYNAERRRGRL